MYFYRLLFLNKEILKYKKNFQNKLVVSKNIDFQNCGIDKAQLLGLKLEGIKIVLQGLHKRFL